MSYGTLHWLSDWRSSKWMRVQRESANEQWRKKKTNAKDMSFNSRTTNIVLMSCRSYLYWRTRKIVHIPDMARFMDSKRASSSCPDDDLIRSRDGASSSWPILHDTINTNRNVDLLRKELKFQNSRDAYHIISKPKESDLREYPGSVVPDLMRARLWLQDRDDITSSVTRSHEVFENTKGPGKRLKTGKCQQWWI